MVFKPFLATTQSWRETRIIGAADLDRLDLVRFAPVIFQHYIDGVDLRVTVVGDLIFAAEIDARATAYPFDMRMVIGEAPMRAIELPGPVHDSLLALQRAHVDHAGACQPERRGGGAGGRPADHRLGAGAGGAEPCGRDGGALSQTSPARIPAGRYRLLAWGRWWTKRCCRRSG